MVWWRKRELRLCEYLQGNRTFSNGKPSFVLGLREGSILHVREIKQKS